MGLCVSKQKHAKPSANGVHHHQHQTPPIQFTMSPGYAIQLPPGSPAPPPASKPNTILGKAYEDVRAHYTLGKELGRGQFGVTHLCTDAATGQQYACKSISKKKLVTKSVKEDMRREIQIMQHLSGQPNIVEFKGAYEQPVRRRKASRISGWHVRERNRFEMLPKALINLKNMDRVGPTLSKYGARVGI